jgi:hypothetical protein
MMAGQRAELTGEALEADVKQRKFQLLIDGQTHVLVMFSDPQEVDVTTALRDHKSVRVRVKGQAEMSPQGKLLRVTEIEELVLSPAGEVPNDSSRHPSRRFWRVWRVGFRRLNGTNSPAT